MAPKRPKIRSECKDGPRPCPWFGCRYHLGIDIYENGRTRLTGSAETCALDVADRGPATLDVIARLLGLSKARVWQIQNEAIESVKVAAGQLDDDSDQ